MSNATRDIKTDQYGTPEAVLPPLYSFPMAASTTVYAGTFGATDASGNVISTLTNAAKIWGRVERQVDNSSGSAGDKSAEIHAGFFYFNNDSTNAVTNAYRGQACYAVDNNTVGTSSVGGSLLYAGYVVDVPASGSVEYGKVLVACGMISPYIVNPELAAASAALYSVRGVATNLDAVTFTSGTFTADANGAMPTQDGLTVAVGDILMIPAGTITTGVVSAANSGPYEITAIGGASAKYTGRRPSWWANGSTIPLGISIKVATGTLFSGTTWQSFVDSSQVVGTNDPKLYPRQVTQQKTLSAGTTTISNVPIFATSRLGLACAMVGGTPDATTTGYNFRITSGRVAGGIGTASAIIDAQATAGGAKVAGDVAVLNITLFNG